MAFATFLVWRLRTGACGVNACGFWRYRMPPAANDSDASSGVSRKAQNWWKSVKGDVEVPKQYQNRISITQKLMKNSMVGLLEIYCRNWNDSNLTCKSSFYIFEFQGSGPRTTSWGLLVNLLRCRLQRQNTGSAKEAMGKTHIQIQATRNSRKKPQLSCGLLTCWLVKKHGAPLTVSDEPFTRNPISVRPQILNKLFSFVVFLYRNSIWWLLATEVP